MRDKYVICFVFAACYILGFAVWWPTQHVWLNHVSPCLVDAPRQSTQDKLDDLKGKISKLSL